jgi:uncharacterized MAPEG superfamily protein
MSAVTDLPAFQPLVLVTVLLVLKMGAVAVATSVARRRALVVLNPEDTKVNPGARAASEEAPATLRAKRAHLNDLENIPAFLFLAVLFTLAGGSATPAWAWFGIYFAARTLHTIFYLNAAQPWRTLSFFVGQIAQLGLLVQLLMLAF